MVNLKFAVLDDHPLIRKGLSEVIQNHPQYPTSSVFAFANSNDLLHFLQSEVVDILFLDLELEGESGVDVNMILKKDFPNVKVIIFSTHVQPKLIKSLYSNGISAYLSKNEESQIIWDCISKVASSHEPYHSPLIQQLLIADATGQKTRHKTFIPTLTKREKEVLKLILDEKSSLEIAAELYLSEHTVESHRSNLFNKLQVKNVAGLVKKALEMDLLKS